MSHWNRIVAAGGLALTLGAAGAWANCNQPESQVKTSGNLPRMLVIRIQEQETQPAGQAGQVGQMAQLDTDTVADGYEVDFRKMVVDSKTAQDANQAVIDQKAEAVSISNSAACDRPAQLNQYLDAMGMTADDSMADSWARGHWGFSIGSRHGGFFFGYGNRGHFGYRNWYPRWGHANYGYYRNGRVYPYYSSPYRYYSYPYGYYYYYSPYYTWY